MVKKALVTGGAGFIGTNLVKRLVSDGWQVEVFDNLSREGSGLNLAWLRKNYKDKLRFTAGDVRDFKAVTKAVNSNEVVFHLAAQVAVTKSFDNPREDFEVNALGSFNVLEAARLSKHKPVVIYASTNKVYGSLDEVKVREDKERYVYTGKRQGIDEWQRLDFHSPYGCSNGVADQYTRDYYRIYDLPTVVFRQSCIYGPWQMGIEDQGWVGFFAKAVIEGKQITIYGNGKQVRDLLYVDDLVEAYLLAVKKISQVKGEVFNIGGGKDNSQSLIEMVRLLEKLSGKKARLKYDKARLGDQKVFISDNTKLEEFLGWQVKCDIERGICLMFDWVKGWRQNEKK